jgi:hypothetical protein
MPRKGQKADGRRAKTALNNERMLIIEKLTEDFSYGCYSRVEREINQNRAKVRYW